MNSNIKETLTLQIGDILGIYGQNGSGKTTGYRLIIEPITVNEKNEIISYESINIVEIMEVSNHYE